MTYVLAIILCLVNAAALFLTALGLPGNWLMVVLTGLVAWWRWDADARGPMFGVTVLIVIGGLALLGEIVEFFAGVAGSKSVGGTRRGAIGALLGALVGGIVGTVAIPIPVLGSVLGACLGAALGAWGFELTGGKSMRFSLKAGAGAGVGRLLGTVAKLALGVAIWLIVAVAAFWP